MDLREFAHHPVFRLNALSELCGLNKDSRELLYEHAQEFDIDEVIFTYKGNAGDKERADVAWYKTRYSNNGYPLYFKYERNKKQPGKDWFLADIYQEDDMLMEHIELKHTSIAEIVFDDLSGLNDFLERIAKEAQEEEWRYTKFKSNVSYPILKSYIEHTYRRLKKEGKLIQSLDGKKMAFNTGLLERNFLLDIFLVFSTKTITILNKSVEVLYRPEIVCEDNSGFTKAFGPVNPELPKFFSSIEDVVFDPDLEIDMNWKHIFIDRDDRIPKDILSSCGDIKDVVQRFRGNEESLRKLAKRNYKMVVPQFYDDHIQFLMPVYLGPDLTGRPDFALVLNHDKEHKLYQGTTILTIEMAYQNARLIAKPENPWIISEVAK